MKFRGIFLLALLLGASPALAQVNPGSSPLSIAKGGTAGATASAARTSLGLAIGTNVEAWNTNLDCLAALASNGVIQRTGSGTCAALTSTQLTALLNLATTSLPGALPAWPNNTTTFFRGDGTYATLNIAALGGLGTGVGAALGTAIGSAGAPVLNGGVGGTPSAISLVNGSGLPASGVTGVFPPANLGGSAASHGVPVDVAGTSTYKVIPDCQDTTGNHINYTQSSDAFTCGNTSSGGGGGGNLTEAQGRLTLTANTPVMTTSAAAQTTLRYDSYIGGNVPYYNGTADAIDTIASNEVTDAMVSAASAGQVVSGQVYDVWWVHSGANRICLAMSSASGGGGGWASDTGGSSAGRGTGFTQIDNVTRPYMTNKNTLANCFNGATNYGSVSANQATYLGTVYASGNGQISYTFGAAAVGGTAALFGVWNAYNRVMVSTTFKDTTASWTYAVASTWRAADASNAMRATFVRGLDEDSVQAQYNASVASGSGTFAVAGIGLDSTTAFSGTTAAIQPFSFASNGNAFFAGTTGPGLHFLQAIEYNTTSTTSTWQGNNGTAYISTGMMVTLRQ